MSAPRVIVCGSRRWTDRKFIADTLNDLVLEFADYPVVVHGGARGADRLAEEEAGKAGLLTEVHLPNYAVLGKRAPLERNEEMAAVGADLCVAFWDGRSSGTRDMLSRAEKHGIPTRVFTKAEAV